jgi:hypothetical protein
MLYRRFEPEYGILLCLFLNLPHIDSLPRVLNVVVLQVRLL